MTTPPSETLKELLENGFHLKDKFFEELHDGKQPSDASALYDEALNCDLRRFGEPALRSDLHATSRLDGLICLQLLSVHNIAQPSARQSTPGLHPQLLQLRLTDGVQKVTALEVSSVPQLSEYDLCFYLSRWMAHFVLGIGLDMVRCGSVSLAPGTKVRVQDCPVRNGKLLLSSANCSVLGGKVYELFTSWKANKELKEKKRIAGADKAEPPPSFTEFVVSQKRCGKKSGKEETQKAAKQRTIPMTAEDKVKRKGNDGNQVAAKKSDGKREKKHDAGKRDRKETAPSKPGGMSAKKKPQNPQDKPTSVNTQLRVESKEFVPSFLENAAPLPPPVFLRQERPAHQRKESSHLASTTATPEKKQAGKNDKPTQNGKSKATDSAEAKLKKAKKATGVPKGAASATEEKKAASGKTDKGAAPKRSEREDSRKKSALQSEGNTSENAEQQGKPKPANSSDSKSSQPKSTHGSKPSGKPAQKYMPKQPGNQANATNEETNGGSASNASGSKQGRRPPQEKKNTPPAAPKQPKSATTS